MERFPNRTLIIALSLALVRDFQHPDYEEDQPPEWLVDVPDPALAEEWEMLSFYRFVNIDQPQNFANMLQVCPGGRGKWKAATS